ncbi:MAG: hypothetical protein R3C99_08935 [Pirellulaceae bacterium]
MEGRRGGRLKLTGGVERSADAAVELAADGWRLGASEVLIGGVGRWVRWRKTVRKSLESSHRR